jgi:hypothetical protein
VASTTPRIAQQHRPAGGSDLAQRVLRSPERRDRRCLRQPVALDQLDLSLLKQVDRAHCDRRPTGDDQPETGEVGRLEPGQCRERLTHHRDPEHGGDPLALEIVEHRLARVPHFVGTRIAEIGR